MFFVSIICTLTLALNYRHESRGVSIIPACNAIKHSLLHIIDFFHVQLIRPTRLAFEGYRTNLQRISGKMHLDSNGQDFFTVHCFTIRTFSDELKKYQL